MENNQPYQVYYSKPTDSSSDLTEEEQDATVVKALCWRLPLKLYRDITSVDCQHKASINISKDDYSALSLILSGFDSKKVLKLSRVSQSSKTVSVWQLLFFKYASHCGSICAIGV